MALVQLIFDDLWTNFTAKRHIYMKLFAQEYHLTFPKACEIWLSIKIHI